MNDNAGWEIIEGDALTVLRGLGDGSVDAVITDPPYSSGGMYRGDRMNPAAAKYVQSGTFTERPDFAGDNRDQHAYRYWCALWMSEVLRVTKPGGSFLVFTDWRQLPTTTDAVQAGGWVWRGIVPWDKGGGVRPRLGFASQAEYVLWSTSGQVDDAPYLPGWIHCTVRQSDKYHITGKPVTLMRELVKIVPPGALILDPFAGSGSTGVAALLEGRRFLGVEKTAAYAQIARRRLEETDNTPRLFPATAEQATLDTT